MKILIFILTLCPMTLMAQSNTDVTEAFLQSFADAFNAHDLDATMEFFADDCLAMYEAGQAGCAGASRG